MMASNDDSRLILSSQPFWVLNRDWVVQDHHHRLLEMQVSLKLAQQIRMGWRSSGSFAAPAVPFSPFNLTYYQSYFDVDTKTVLNRCFQACIPRGGFINDVCEERIDLYGA